MTDFWSGVFGNSPVIQPTTGETLPPPQNIPYYNLLGGAQGLDPSINNAGAQAVFPNLSPDPNSPDSLIVKAGRPAGFDSLPSALAANVFASWHTAYQEEYINLHKGEAPKGILKIGSDPDVIHATLSTDQTKVYILEALQKADFASMLKADQQRIAADPVSMPTLTRLGMVATETNIDGPDSPYQKMLDAISANTIMSADDKKVFSDELDNIKKRIDASGVYSPTDINAAVQAVQNRFERVAVFAASLVANLTRAFDDPRQQLNVITAGGQQGLEGIRNGLQAFMNAERQVLAADNAAMQIANTGTLVGLTKHLDAPNLLAAFQLAANLKDQAINAGDTEEINQINDLLKTYNALQALINETVAAFDASKNDEKRGLLGYNANDDADNNTGDPFKEGETRVSIGVLTDPQPINDGHINPKALTADQLNLISMFETNLGGAASPIEQRYHIDRPAFDFYDNTGKTLNYFQKSTWDQFSATLSNTVQQISQENQLKFNDINTLEKERTTHFQSATNALSKASDIIASIGRNVA